MSEATRRIWSVTELAEAIKSRLEENFPDVFVRGEVATLATPASGHIYFTIKDETSSIRCILYRHIHRYLRVAPEAGREFLVRGKVSSYGPRSEYQLVVDYLEPAGLGALYAAFLQMQKKLAAKGYFEQNRKRPLPFLPETIGIVTSLSGAALHDMLRIIYARRPGQHVVIAPTLVQGETAPIAIARAIEKINETVQPDVLIVGRGGGSPEDLWAWNEEAVVEAVVNSIAPVISGVGHEIDVSLCDLAADVRAATPTHAAELAVPKIDDVLTGIANQRRRLLRAVKNQTIQARERHTDLNRRLLREGVPTAQLVRRLDELNARMTAAISRLLTKHRHRVSMLAQQHRGNAPRARLSDQHARLSALQQRLLHRYRLLLQAKQRRLDGMETMLTALSPLSVLSRGYAIVSNEKGEALRVSTEAQIDEKIAVRLHRGRIAARVEDIETD